MYIISKCLLGHNCKYNGGNNKNENVIEFCNKYKYIAVCPESLGNLPYPRPPAEITEGCVIDKNGRDVTQSFADGAKAAMNICIKVSEELGERLEGAILKANSPSCGYGKVYDGTFSGVLTDGNGIFARLLKENGIDIITEKEKIKW